MDKYEIRMNGIRLRRPVVLTAIDAHEALDIYCAANGWKDYAEFQAARGNILRAVKV